MFSTLLKKDKKKGTISKEEFARLFLRIQAALFPIPPPESAPEEGQDPEALLDVSLAYEEHTQDVDAYVSRVCDIWGLSQSELFLKITGKKPRKATFKPKLISSTTKLLEDPENAQLEDRLAVYKYAPFEVPAVPEIDPSKPAALTAKVADVDFDYPALTEDWSRSFHWNLWFACREKRYVVPPVHVLNRVYRRHVGVQRTTSTDALETLRAIVIGRPLVGKSTVAAHIAAEKGVLLVSMTGIIASNPELSGLLRKGALIPPEKLYAAFSAQVCSKHSQHAGFVIDDFPEGFDFSSLPAALQINVVIDLDCPTGVLLKRISEVKMDANSGKIYSPDDFLALEIRRLEKIAALQAGIEEDPEPVEEAAEGDEEPKPKEFVSIIAPSTEEELEKPQLDIPVNAQAFRFAINCNTKRSEVLKLVSCYLGKFAKASIPTLEEPQVPEGQEPPAFTRPVEVVTYDVVSFVDFHEISRVAEDVREFTAFHGGRQFFFSTEKNRDAFVSCGRRYAREVPFVLNPSLQYPHNVFEVIPKLELSFGVIAAKSREDAEKIGRHFPLFSILSVSAFLNHVKQESFEQLKERVDREWSSSPSGSSFQDATFAYIVYAPTFKELNLISDFADFIIEYPVPPKEDGEEEEEPAPAEGEEKNETPADEESKFKLTFPSHVAADPFYPPLEILEGEDAAMESVNWREFGKYPFGPSFIFDPIDLIQNPSMFVPGKPSIAAKCAFQMFWFRSEDNRNAFMQSPLSFVNQIIALSPASKEYHPRLWVAGPRYSGKTTLSQSLQKRLHVPVVEASQAFLDSLMEDPASVAGRMIRRVQNGFIMEDEMRNVDKDVEKKKRAHERKLARDAAAAAAVAEGTDPPADDGEEEAEPEEEPEAEELVVERQARRTAMLVSTLLTSEPYASGGYILDGISSDLLTSNVFNLLVDELRVVPDSTVVLTCPDDVAQDRWKNEFTKTPDGKEWLAKLNRPGDEEVEEEEGEPMSDPTETFRASFEESNGLVSERKEKLSSVCPNLVEFPGTLLTGVLYAHVSQWLQSGILDFCASSTKERVSESQAVSTTSNPEPIRILLHSGDRVLAKSVADRLGLRYISARSILEDFYYLQGEPTRILKTGAVIPSDLWLRLLDSVVCEADCISRGFLIDDDFDMEQVANDYERYGIHCVFYLIPSGLVLADQSRHALRASRFRSSNVFCPAFVNQISSEGAQLWKLRSDIVSSCESLRNSIRTAKQNANSMYSIYRLPIKSSEFTRTISASPMKSYCIVSWIRDGLLVDCSSDLGREFYVAFNDGGAQRVRYFATASSEKMQYFFDHAHALVSALAMKPLPTSLPSIPAMNRLAAAKRSSFALHGYSPVSLLRGSLSVAAVYEGKIFAFADDADRSKFLLEPWKFAGRKLPASIQAKVSSWSALGLDDEEDKQPTIPMDPAAIPAAGYLDIAGVNETVSKGMLYVSELFRQHGGLKHPQLSTKETAVKLLALYLKTMARGLHKLQLDRAQRKLDEFIRASTLATKDGNEPDVASQWDIVSKEDVRRYVAID
eukprot:ANDGO_03089.mRNA.1 hypothetical protein